MLVGDPAAPVKSQPPNKMGDVENPVAVDISTEALTVFKHAKNLPRNNTREFSYIGDVHLTQIMAMQMHSKLMKS
jgi:hypothetical protein